MSTLQRVILFIVMFLLIVAVGAVAFFQFWNRRVSSNDNSVIGNTPGNIHNGGLFCENDGKVYFSNPSDGGRLYSMDSDETNVKRLSYLKARSISSADRFVYFIADYSGQGGNGAAGVAGLVNEYGIFRIRNDGDYQKNLLRMAGGLMQLGGNYLYYQSGDETTGTLERIHIDQKDRDKTGSVIKELVDPSCYNNGTIYYTGVKNDHGLHSLNPETGATSMLYTGNVYQPQIRGTYFYFADPLNDYRISVLSIASGQVTALSSLPVDVFNLDDSFIFFDSQNDTAPGLYRMTATGGNLTYIAPGIFSSIHLTENYVYVQQYGSDMIYHMPLTGNSLTIFDPGSE